MPLDSGVATRNCRSFDSDEATGVKCKAKSRSIEKKTATMNVAAIVHAEDAKFQNGFSLPRPFFFFFLLDEVVSWSVELEALALELEAAAVEFPVAAVLPCSVGASFTCGGGVGGLFDEAP